MNVFFAPLNHRVCVFFKVMNLIATVHNLNYNLFLIVNASTSTNVHDHFIKSKCVFLFRDDINIYQIYSNKFLKIFVYVKF